MAQPSQGRLEKSVSGRPLRRSVLFAPSVRPNVPCGGKRATNPIEKYWAWLRKALLARDLSDAVAKRPALDKAGYTTRVRAICRTQRSHAVAAACSKSLRKTCAEVIRKKGAATRG